MGVVMTAAGSFLHPVFPINKQLWTSTYVLFTAGVASLFLGLCLGLMDGFGRQKWAYPFLVLGTNAIFVYVASTVMVKILVSIMIPTGQEAIALYPFIYDRLLAPWAGPFNGSLLFPLLLLGFWVLVMIPLYRKRIFIKI
jgi:predicted acyltransferase